MKSPRGWRWRYLPLPYTARWPLASRPGVPEFGFVLRTQRGEGTKTHAPLVFALDDLWTFAFGVRSLCFTSGGPWVIEGGKPTCARCGAILARWRATVGKPA